MKTVGILLAAGHSRRFGAADKLLAPYRGKPLVVHAAEALTHAKVDELVAVVASPDVRACVRHFECVQVTSTDHTQSESLRAGLLRAQALGVTQVVIVLGDMPLVTPQLINRVVEVAANTGISAAFDGQRPMPPACFPQQSFEALKSAEGDRGASSILRALPREQLVDVGPDILADVDAPKDLKALPYSQDGCKLAVDQG
ncbi:MAG: nucleotidyltransferase family protein [Pseudomonadota bacterium]